MENREWELIDQNEELYRSNVTLEVELRAKEQENYRLIAQMRNLTFEVENLRERTDSTELRSWIDEQDNAINDLKVTLNSERLSSW